MELCTWPSESNPMKCSVPPVRFACAIALWSVAFFAKSPEAMSESITTMPCGTVRPLPMLMWPTSLLPMMPLGSPTASPLASICAHGYVASIRFQFGVSAAAIALPASRPSRYRQRRNAGFYRSRLTRSAHFEHTIAITENGPRVLTALAGEPVGSGAR